MRVLSIQSHVVSGYVGNKVAVFPLQLLGCEVDVINSCSLSNHTGYRGGAPGQRLSGDDLREAVAGLVRNDLLISTTHLLTGFIGTASFLDAVVDVVRTLRAREGTPVLDYVCDPVLGDNGKLYVPHELVFIYRERILPLATVLTPNVFELGLLAGVTIEDEHSAFDACSQLHTSSGVPLIIVTGAQFKDRQQVVSILVSATDGTKFALDTELLHGRFTGSGDLTAALILAWRHFEPNDLRKALCQVMGTVSSVLHRTLLSKRRSAAISVPELCLIQSRDDILHPQTSNVRVREINH